MATERNFQMHIRLTQTEKTLLLAAAERAQMSLSDFVRLSILAGAKQLVEGDAEGVEMSYNSTGRLLASLASGQSRLIIR